MDNTLDLLLELSEATPEDKFNLVRRVKGDNGLVKEVTIPFVIKGIRPSVSEQITKRCTVKGVYNEEEATLHTIAESCIEPNFKDPALLEKLKVSDAAQAVKRILMAGEVTQVSQRILAVSGFNRGAIVDVEAVKNE
jgi:hypothetical protein